MPQKSQNGTAADCWAAFARHTEGQPLANAAHEAMKARFSTWVWPMGCIEDALNIVEKGEAAIIAQEDNIRSWQPETIDQVRISLIVTGHFANNVTGFSTRLRGV